MTLPLVTPGSEENQEQYHWTFNGRIMVIDNGSRLTAEDGFQTLMGFNSFAVVSFDPLNKLSRIKGLEQTPELQIVPNTTLGNGSPVIRYDCLNERTSATLKPLDATLANTKATNHNASGPNLILAQPTIASIALDDIDGLNRLDWLLLDEFNDNVAILQNATHMLRSTLLIDMRIPFQFSHEGQADYTVIHHFLNDLGFRFYRFHKTTFKTDLPKDIYLEKNQFSDTLTTTTLFLPTDERLAELPPNELLKLGFLLHTVYQCKDTAYRMLHYADPDLAREYLIAEGFLWPVDTEETEFVLTESYSPDIWAKERNA